MVEKATILLQKDPNHVRYNLLMGQALAEQERFSEAIPYLNKVVSHPQAQASKGWALYYLGRCYYILGNRTEAKAKLLECRELNASKNSVEDSVWCFKLFGFDDYYNDWRTLESEHFVFHFQPSFPVGELQQFLEERERDFADLQQYFDSEISKKIDVYIYGSLEAYRQMMATPSRPDLGGNAAPPFCIIHVGPDMTTFKHELTYIVTYHLQECTSFQYLKDIRFDILAGEAD